MILLIRLNVRFGIKNNGSFYEEIIHFTGFKN